MSESKDESPAASGVFVQTVAAMSGGRTLEKLEDSLREATRAAAEAGAKSKLSLELTITPAGEGTGGEQLFKVTGKVKKTLPEKPEKGSNFFVDEEFNLSRRNPNQTTLGLTVVGGGKITKDMIGAGQAKAAAGS